MIQVTWDDIIAPLVKEINAKIKNAQLQPFPIIKNKRKDNVLKRLNLLKSYYNKNGNLAKNLYNATSSIKIKREFSFTFSKKPLNRFSQ